MLRRRRRASPLPHAVSCLCLATPSSCQLWLTKPVTFPRLAGAVFAKSPVSSFETRSVDCSSASGSARKRAFASESALDAEPPPTSALIVAASASFVLLVPIEPKKAGRGRGCEAREEGDAQPSTNKTTPNCRLVLLKVRWLLIRAVIGV